MVSYLACDSILSYVPVMEYKNSLACNYISHNPLIYAQPQNLWFVKTRFYKESIYHSLRKIHVGNVHVKKVHGKIFSSSWVVNEIFLAMNVLLLCLQSCA